MSGLEHRHLEPEILDGLAGDDPRALAARRDLRRINALMFQAEPSPAPISRIRRGSFMLAVARRIAGRWPGVELVMLDRIGLITTQLRGDFDRLGWTVEGVTADVFDWARNNEGTRFDAITVNLFLHHFDDAELVRLFALMAPKAPLLLATEPLRTKLALAATRLLPAIGANDVTRNDAAQSVRAGFRDNELSGLW
ncbi:MAG: class I SAM-dependent methyltransferase, partial [Mesorhizobium sp.]